MERVYDSRAAFMWAAIKTVAPSQVALRGTHGLTGQPELKQSGDGLTVQSVAKLVRDVMRPWEAGSV